MSFPIPFCLAENNEALYHSNHDDTEYLQLTLDPTGVRASPLRTALPLSVESVGSVGYPFFCPSGLQIEILHLRFEILWQELRSMSQLLPVY